MAATLKLQSSDGKTFEVNINAAKQSTTIKTMLNDLGIENEAEDQVVPLPNVTSSILEKIIEWATEHKEDPDLTEEDEFKYFEIKFEDLPKWDQDYILGVDMQTLCELTLAANYLEMKGLLNLTCKGIASKMIGKSPAELRKTFNVKCDEGEK